MTYFAEISIIDSIIVFFAAAVPVYLSLYLRNKLRILTILLAMFAIIHASYHVSEVFENEVLAEDVLEPISVALLIVFGLIYLRMLKDRRIHA